MTWLMRPFSFRLLVAAGGFPSEALRQSAVDFCLEEGIELVDFTEEEEDEEDDGGGGGLLDGRGAAKRRPKEALQVMNLHHLLLTRYP